MAKSPPITRVKFQDVSKSFKVPHDKPGKHIFSRGKSSILTVLNDASFEIKDGEFVGIVGRNGSGKSTLLKLLAGIYYPDKGQIDVKGSIAPFLELGVGFSPELTARENVYLNASILGLTTSQIDKAFKEIISFAELEDFVDQKLKNFSSGMQVRLAFSVAIRAKADILLLDEVLAVGDAKFQAKCFNIFRQYKREGRTVVFVSHDINKVQEYCTRAIYLRDGKIVADSNPADVSTQYMLDYSKEIGADKGKSDSKTGIQIQSITFDNGQESKVQKMDQPVKFSIKYKASHKQPIIIGVGISQNERFVAGFNTRLDMEDYTAKKGLNTVHCQIDSGQLGRGAFTLDALAYDRSEDRKLLDRVNHLGTLNILDKVKNRDGVVNLKGTWSKNK